MPIGPFQVPFSKYCFDISCQTLYGSGARVVGVLIVVHCAHAANGNYKQSLDAIDFFKSV
jgi:hypothetical protein